ncbi:MAG: hypothetical protein GY948_21645 [Alphaproteobacteria bacterium]|nr:hypothetical protein [Alphaproteobacteria bacterium]
MRYLHWHMMAYAGATVIVVILHYVSPAERGIFMPVMLWGVFVLAHFLTVRAINTDPKWVEERSENITMNATDLSHIEDIRERHDKRLADAESKRLSNKAKNEEVK